MPQVRSLRGGRSAFSPAKVSSTISKAYLQMHRGNTVRYRKQIQEHTQRVIEVLGQTLGSGQKTEWPREAIGQAIEAELREHASTAIYELYLADHPQPEPVKPEEWDRFEAMPRPEAQRTPSNDDPVWSVLWPKTDEVEETAEPSVLHTMGDEVFPLPVGKKVARVRHPPVRRSQWLDFWRELAQATGEAMDVSFLLDIARQDPLQHAMTPDGWWRHWQALFDRALPDDPRLIRLMAAARRRKLLAEAMGGSWLADSPLSPEPVTLLKGPEGAQRYRAMWVRHMLELNKQKKIRPGLVSRYNLKELSKVLDMERDALIDWRGFESLDAAGGLWPILPEAWTRLVPGARELPQWAFLRLAMEAAADEDKPLEQAQRFYQALSTRLVVLVDALREAGQHQPDFLEDQTGRVGDDFEAIHDAIRLAAVATKWNGTVALDWRQVRAAGSSIAGQRTSQGVVGFWRSLDMVLAAQGRQGDDRPVTVALPLWHREALELLDLREERTPRLQPTLLIPDLFFERLSQQGKWHLFDPAVFPEVRTGTEEGYLAAEAAMESRRKRYPHAVAEVSADRLWRRLMRALVKGSPFLVFEGSQLAAAPFPVTAPPNVGLEGVGALPLPMKAETLTSTHWASAAVNLAQTVDGDGQPQIEAIQDAVQIALRLLDNLTMRIEGKNPAPMRSVCLGAIGYYEAIELASAHVRHDSALVGAWVARLAEVWHTVVQRANRDLARERGRAPGWAVPDARPLGPGAFRGRLGQARKGQLPGLARSPEEEAFVPPRYDERHDALGGRFVVCSVWAPFENAARLAGTTPGGIGTLYPIERVVDTDGRTRLVPTPFLLHHIDRSPDRLATWAQVMRSPEHPQRWPEAIARLAHPDREAWEERLRHAALMRPWLEQGVSLTLPVQLPEPLLHQLIRRAWWLGLNSIRFAPSLGAPVIAEPILGMDNMDDDP